MQYTDLIFDLYGTLVDIHTEENELTWEKTALYFSYYGVHYTGSALKTDYESVIASRESVAGQGYEMYPDIPFHEVLADLFRAKGITAHADALGLNAAQVFRIASTEYLRLYDGVTDALSKLRKHGYRLWLLSNAQRAFTAYELRALTLEDQFDRIYLSSDYHCRKPDQRFFQALLHEQKLDPARCLMIGNDRETDIAGAQAAGLATLYMHTNLTPSQQAAADPSLRLEPSANRRHYEFEGYDWQHLADALCLL
ncbi:MAG: HAD family hydrolase [Clostridiales bacterium]|nr:HAD family hydrolase [Clostridiales bacterium]